MIPIVKLPTPNFPKNQLATKKNANQRNSQKNNKNSQKKDQMNDYLPWAGDCRPNQSVGRASPHPLVAIKKLNKILENERKT